MWISRKEHEALLKRIELASTGEREANEAVALLRKQTEEKIGDLEDRLAEVEKSYRRGSLEHEKPEEIVIDRGHVPFTQRKRNWEASKKQQPKGKQNG